MYDPSIGRWLSEDPIGFDAINKTDPSGLAEFGYPVDYTELYPNPTARDESVPWENYLFPDAVLSTQTKDPDELVRLLLAYNVTIFAPRPKGQVPWVWIRSQAFDNVSRFQQIVDSENNRIAKEVAKLVDQRRHELCAGSDGFTVKREVMKGQDFSIIGSGGAIGWAISGKHRIDVIHDVKFGWVHDLTTVNITSTYSWHDRFDWHDYSEAFRAAGGDETGVAAYIWSFIEGSLHQVMDKSLERDFYFTIIYKTSYSHQFRAKGAWLE